MFYFENGLSIIYNIKIKGTNKKSNTQLFVLLLIKQFVEHFILYVYDGYSEYIF